LAFILSILFSFLNAQMYIVPQTLLWLQLYEATFFNVPYLLQQDILLFHFVSILCLLFPITVIKITGMNAITKSYTFIKFQHCCNFQSGNTEF